MNPAYVVMSWVPLPPVKDTDPDYTLCITTHQPGPEEQSTHGEGGFDRWSPFPSLLGHYICSYGSSIYSVHIKTYTWVAASPSLQYCSQHTGTIPSKVKWGRSTPLKNEGCWNSLADILFASMGCKGWSSRPSIMPTMGGATILDGHYCTSKDICVW